MGDGSAEMGWRWEMGVRRRDGDGSAEFGVRRRDGDGSAEFGDGGLGDEGTGS